MLGAGSQESSDTNQITTRGSNKGLEESNSTTGVRTGETQEITSNPEYDLGLNQLSPFMHRATIIFEKLSS